MSTPGLHYSPRRNLEEMALKQLARQFTPLNSFAFLSVANSSCNANLTNAPKVILVFAWLDADMRNIQKYTEGYHVLFPEADQVIIRSDKWSLWWSNLTRNAALQPVVELLHARGIYTLHEPSSRVILHVMSNGGCFQLVALSRLLAPSSSKQFKQSTDSIALSLDSQSGAAFVFDSCPGLATFTIMAKALTSSIKNRWLRMLASFPAGLMSLILTRSLFPGSIFNSKLEPFAQLREHLTDATLIPPSAPRLYIYSTPDQLVPVKDVEAHIEQAKEKGVQSLAVLKDETSGHVDHLRRDPAAYWETIRKLWVRG